jgi:hypothetical protein
MFHVAACSAMRDRAAGTAAAIKTVRETRPRSRRAETALRSRGRSGCAGRVFLGLLTAVSLTQSQRGHRRTPSCTAERADYDLRG